MSMANLIELGFTERQLVNAAAAYIATGSDGKVDFDAFMPLAGYSTLGSATSKLAKSKREIKAIQASRGYGDGSASAAPATPKRKAQAQDGGKSAKKPKSAKAAKAGQETTAELEDDEELGSVMMEQKTDMARIKKEEQSDNRGFDDFVI